MIHMNYLDVSSHFLYKRKLVVHVTWHCFSAKVYTSTAKAINKMAHAVNLGRKQPDHYADGNEK